MEQPLVQHDMQRAIETLGFHALQQRSCEQAQQVSVSAQKSGHLLLQGDHVPSIMARVCECYSVCVCAC